MIYIATEEFFCEELNSQLQAGEKVDLTMKEAAKYNGQLRLTTMPKRPRFRYGR